MDDEGDGEKQKQMPPASVMTKLILVMVWRKLIRNPNTYSSLLGIAWSLISPRYSKNLSHIFNGHRLIWSASNVQMIVAEPLYGYLYLAIRGGRITPLVYWSGLSLLDRQTGVLALLDHS
jgi:hypothetical protein